MALPVALQVYSVRGAASNDLRAALEEIKAIGYDGVEFAGLYGHTAAEVKAMCSEIGLVPISAHVPYGDLVSDPKGVLETYAEIGCKFIAIPYLEEDYRPNGSKFDEMVKNTKLIGKLARDLGMRLLYHNHDFEFATLNGKYILDILYEEISADLLETELDTCWVNIGGEDPAKYLEKYSGRSPVVHLKDFYGEKSDDMYELIGIEKKAPKRPSNLELRPVGSGVQDFPAILAAAERAETQWLVVEQDQASMGLSPMECAAKSREYLKTLGY